MLTVAKREWFCVRIGENWLACDYWHRPAPKRGYDIVEVREDDRPSYAAQLTKREAEKLAAKWPGSRVMPWGEADEAARYA